MPWVKVGVCGVWVRGGVCCASSSVSCVASWSVSTSESSSAGRLPACGGVPLLPCGSTLGCLLQVWRCADLYGLPQCLQTCALAARSDLVGTRQAGCLSLQCTQHACTTSVTTGPFVNLTEQSVCGQCSVSVCVCEGCVDVPSSDSESESTLGPMASNVGHDACHVT